MCELALGAGRIASAAANFAGLTREVDPLSQQATQRALTPVCLSSTRMVKLRSKSPPAAAVGKMVVSLVMGGRLWQRVSPRQRERTARGRVLLGALGSPAVEAGFETRPLVFVKQPLFDGFVDKTVHLLKGAAHSAAICRLFKTIAPMANGGLDARFKRFISLVAPGRLQLALFCARLFDLGFWLCHLRLSPV